MSGKGTRARKATVQDPSDEDLFAAELGRRLTRALGPLRAPNKKPYTYEAIAEATGMSPSHAWQMINGGAKNPTMTHLRNMATFCQVPLAYLVGGDEKLDREVEADLDDLELMQRHCVRAVVYQMAAMTDEGQEVVKDLGPRIAALPAEARLVVATVLSGLEGMAGKENAGTSAAGSAT